MHPVDEAAHALRWVDSEIRDELVRHDRRMGVLHERRDRALQRVREAGEQDRAERQVALLD